MAVSWAPNEENGGLPFRRFRRPTPALLLRTGTVKVPEKGWDLHAFPLPAWMDPMDRKASAPAPARTRVGAAARKGTRSFSLPAGATGPWRWAESGSPEGKAEGLPHRKQLREVPKSRSCCTNWPGSSHPSPCASWKNEHSVVFTGTLIQFLKCELRKVKAGDEQGPGSSSCPSSPSVRAYPKALLFQLRAQLQSQSSLGQSHPEHMAREGGQGRGDRRATTHHQPAIICTWQTLSVAF